MKRAVLRRAMICVCLALWMTAAGGATVVAADPHPISFVPPGVSVVVVGRPVDLLKEDAFGPLYNEVKDEVKLAEMLGFPLEQVTRAMIAGNLNGLQPDFVVTLETDRDVDWSTFIKSRGGETTSAKVGPYNGNANPGRNFHAVTVSPRMFVFASNHDLLVTVVASAPEGPKRSPWLKPLAELDESVAVAAAVDHSWFRAALEQKMAADRNDSAFLGETIVAPIVRDVKRSWFQLRLKPRLQLDATIESTAADKAVHVKKTLDAINVLLGNMARGYLDLSPLPKTSAEKLRNKAVDYGGKLSAAVTSKLEGSTVVLSTSLDVPPAELAKTLIDASKQLHDQTQRVVASNNLKQILLAMHNYEAIHKRFPGSQNSGAREGDPPHSWRVALLPYLEELHLYDQYKFDEPWDSPNNIKLVTKMPKIFADPSGPAGSTSSTFYMTTGPGGFSTDGKPVRISSITDGTSNTIAVVQAKRDIPWTKPEDIVIDPKKPLPELGGFVVGQILVGIGDGSVRFIPQDISESTLRALFTRAGGELIDLNQ